MSASLSKYLKCFEFFFFNINDPEESAIKKLDGGSGHLLISMYEDPTTSFILCLRHIRHFNPASNLYTSPYIVKR